ncbi:MAG: hypothetical protein KGZ25_15075, partial [Planctomycetes bacterium]|nr:hypothetical protein [Planctomycetota bacterium]
LILLGLLKQHVPVLPLRKTAWFTLKLLVLTAAVGGATWVVNRQVGQRIDYTSTRQHKVVVSNFETGPDTWFSVNASDIGIEKSPAGDLAVAMQHKRQGNVRCSIYRRLAGLRLDSLEEVLVRFHAMVRDPAGGIVVEGERKKGFETVFDGDISHEDWTECEFSLAEPSQVETLHWREAASDRKKPNVLYIREVTISGPEGREIWTENFAQPGWSALSTSDSQVPTLQDTRLDEEASRYALRIPAGGVERDLSGYNFSGTELFRCRLRNTTGEPATARIALHTGDKRVEQEVDLDPDGWQKIDLTAEKLGFKNLERFQAIDGVTISVPRDGIFLDDVTFRRPPSAKYELQKLIHCVIPTLGGMIVGLVALLLLRFDETSDVIQWVKNKGWQRSEEDAEEMLE